MRSSRVIVVVVWCVFWAVLTGCAEHRKETRSVTVEGPSKKTEIKIERTEKEHH